MTEDTVEVMSVLTACEVWMECHRLFDRRRGKSEDSQLEKSVGAVKGLMSASESLASDNDDHVGKGSVMVEAQVGGQWLQLQLCDVWYVPQLSRNLFSVLATQDKKKPGIDGKLKLEGTRRGQRERATSPGERIHSDVCGPFRHSLSNDQYFVLLKDVENSRFHSVYYRQISEVPEKLKPFSKETQVIGHVVK
ncbi:hypothetical protein PR048_027825 [Dryococelus australis]|uniref:Retrovirus-related Pol polyprotein from transposon TNT 1-94-like beta-barrel domain-containing protein n=1 Tax=Dryococelus australis TaxID=614101 RepID=A0ABQ9GHM0_9NEOP|nr:hypothetical protein PR048_027825 [Dryococelus australis]